jgi:hypothetical protein
MTQTLAGYACLYQNSTVGTLHLTNQIVFGGSAVKRPRGQKHEHILDGVRCA